MRRKIICAIDTADLELAQQIVKRLHKFVGAFKVGHALTLPHGLDVIDRLQDVGAERIFLDLKFHDIPNSVARGVREAARRGVWMTTVHLSGGPAMLSAAVEEAHAYAENEAPCLVGVSVLTSIDEVTLQQVLGVSRTLEDHMVLLSKMGIDCGLDGVVCSVHEASLLRKELGHAILVTPGIRPAEGKTHDQKRVGDAKAALSGGADYLVIGRVLTDALNPEDALRGLGLLEDEAVH